MKKILALALALMLCLCSVAFAADYDNLIGKNPTFTKTYTVNNDGIAPAETFTFEFAFESYTNPTGESNVVDATNAPVIEDVTVEYAASNADGWVATQTLTIPVSAEDFPYVGKYVYNVTEVDNNTEGVTYNTQNIKLVVTVMHDASNAEQFVAVVHLENLTGTKEVGVTNQYNAGTLTVSKTITGNMADMNKKFDFTVTFTAGDNDVLRSTINTTADVTWNDYTATFALGHGDSITFSNIPAGATYTVTEDKENYTIAAEDYSDSEKVISAGDQDTVAFTNELTTEVDTGIALDNAPYMIVLALVVVAGVMMMKKRSYNA